MSIYNFLTRKQISLPRIADRDLPTYPSEFFSNHNELTVKIPKYEGTENDLRKSVAGGIKNTDLSIDIAKRFLYNFFSKINLDLDREWKSFGVKIGDRGQKINPFRLIRVIETEACTSTSSDSATEKDDPWMVFYILSLYRIGKATLAEYRAQIATAGDNLLKNFSLNAADLHSGYILADTWTHDVDYGKICAVVDMFFAKFKDHPFAVFRFGTIVSRYKDCSALISINHLAKMSGGSIEEGVKWIFTESVSEDLTRLTKEGQEVDQADSFTPYMTDLKISKLSPYSTTQNTAFHLFVHVAGTFLLYQRSINARWLEATGEQSIIQNAGLFAYIMSTRLDLKYIYGKDSSDTIDIDPRVTLIEDEDEDDDNDENDENLPRSKDPKDWFKWLKMNDFILPRVVQNFMKEQSGKIPPTRQGTIGEKIRRLYSGQNMN